MKFQARDLPKIMATKEAVNKIVKNQLATPEQKWEALYELQKHILSSASAALTKWVDGKIKKGVV